MKISNLYKKRSKDISTVKNILILGNAEYGVTNEVLEIENEKDIIRTYGRNSSIYQSYKEIKNEVGNYEISVFALKYNGEHATASFKVNSKEEVIEEALIFKSIYSNEIYNNVSINVTLTGIEMIFPFFLNLDKKIYHYTDFPNLYMLMKKINEDTVNGDNIVFVYSTIDEYTEFDESFYYINESKKLSCGNSGLNDTNNDKFKALELSYELIQGLEIDYIVLSDIYYNDTVTYRYLDGRTCSFYEQLLSFCVSQLRFSIISLGIMQVDTEGVENSKVSIDKSINEVISLMDITHSNYTLSQFRFLIAIMYDFLIKKQDFSKFNSSLVIAFELSKIQTSGNITGKPLNEDYYLNLFLDEEQIRLLNEKGIMTFRLSPYYNRVVATNGLTNYTSQDSSLNDYNNEYKYLTSIVLLQNTIPKLKSIFNDRIGESIYELEREKALEDDLTVVLNELVKKGVLEKYSTSIDYSVENCSINFEVILQNMFVTEGIKYIGKLSYNDLE